MRIEIDGYSLASMLRMTTEQVDCSVTGDAAHDTGDGVIALIAGQRKAEAAGDRVPDSGRCHRADGHNDTH